MSAPNPEHREDCSHDFDDDPTCQICGMSAYENDVRQLRQIEALLARVARLVAALRKLKIAHWTFDDDRWEDAELVADAALADDAKAHPLTGEELAQRHGFEPVSRPVPVCDDDAEEGT